MKYKLAMSKRPREVRNHQNQKQSTSSARGFASVIATCDAAREREATKELTNLLNQVHKITALLKILK